MDLEELFEKDKIEQQTVRGKTCYIHDSHRFVLPLVYLSQKEGILPKPCKIISFDFHTDTCDVKEDCLEEIKKFSKSGDNLDGLIEITERLCRNNDDWIFAGIYLGLFSDVIVFGASAHQISEEEKHIEVIDILGEKHYIEIKKILPWAMLKDKGELNNLTKEKVHNTFWNFLRWNINSSKNIFELKEDNEKILFDIDLDVFTEYPKGNMPPCPWKNRKFEENFSDDKGEGLMINWSGKKITNHFIDQSGLITIAREPYCCGGEKEMKNIYSKVKKYLFNNEI